MDHIIFEIYLILNFSPLPHGDIFTGSSTKYDEREHQTRNADQSYTIGNTRHSREHATIYTFILYYEISAKGGTPLYLLLFFCHVCYPASGNHD